MDGAPRDIADLIDYWRRVTPDRTALCYGELSWTWAQWADRVYRNAAAQVETGLGPGDRIACLVRNHPSCLETTLASALIGTACVVVNFRLTAEEVAYVINDARAVVVLVGAEYVPILAGIRESLPTVRQVVVVDGNQDGYESWLASTPPLRQPSARQPDDCFLQLYTSGTTGFPKGAMLTHRGMTAHARACTTSLDLSADTVAMVAMPLFHVGGSSWALVALYHGARVVVVRDIDPPALLTELVSQRVTNAFLVPAVFAFLLNVPGVTALDYSALRAFSYGGSPMPLPLLRRCLATFPADFYQVYGMTEACGVVTALGPREHRDASGRRLGSVGRPISGVELAVVDPASGTRLGPGQVGEVLVRAEQLMAGYWNDPLASQDVLLSDGWLRTGDVGQLDKDGYLYLVDRVKDVFISGGENVYPAEIERVLVEHPSVREVALIGVPDERWGEVGKAIVVAEAEAKIEPEELLAYCRERLASYKCPRSVDVIAQLPRNPAGKVLKRELRVLHRDNSSPTR